MSVHGGRAEARNSFVVVMPWSVCGSNGKYRRHRAVPAIPRFIRLGSDDLNVCRIALPFDPHGVHGMTAARGFRASARPPSALRTPLFARHSHQITTQKRVFSESGDRSHWRWRVSDIAK